MTRMSEVHFTMPKADLETITSDKRDPEPELSSHMSTDCSGNALSSDNIDTVALPEPLPDFTNVTKSWNIAFPMFTYSLGTAFLLLSIYAFHSSWLIFYMSSQGRLSKRRKTLRPFIIAMNIQIILLGMCRASTLLIDPYNIDHSVPPLFYDILFNIPFPCLSSAFGLLNWVVLQVSKLKLTSTSKITSITFLLTVILAHYVAVITVCFVTHYVTTDQIIIIVCKGFFVIWGLVLCIGFFVGAAKIYRLENSTQEVLYQNTLICPTPKTNRRIGLFNENNRRILSRTATLSVSPVSTPSSSPYLKRKSSPGSILVSTSSISASPLSMRKSHGFASPTWSPTLSRKLEELHNSSTTKKWNDSVTLSKSPPPSLRLSKNIRRSKQVYCFETDINKPVTSTNTTGLTPVSLTMMNNDGPAAAGDEAMLNGPTHRDYSPCSRRRVTGILFEKIRKISDSSTSSIQQARNTDINLQQRSRRATGKVLRISAASAVLGLAASGLNIYGLLSVYVGNVTLDRDRNRPELWSWYIYQFHFR